MRIPCLALLLIASTSCSALPNPDRRAWSEEAPPLTEIREAAEVPEHLAPTPVPPAPAAAAAPAASNPQASRIWVYLGGRQLDDDYTPAEDQGLVGLEYSYEGTNWVVGWEAGIMGSFNDDNLAGSVGVGELYGGVRKTFRRYAKFQPYLGAGLSLASVRVAPLLGAEEQEATVGGYAHGGLSVLLGQSFHLGLDLRTLFGADVTVGTTDTNINYTQLALVLGWLL